ncbi:hypothetical protein, partial [Fulvivirga kasyanovii]
MTEIQYPTAQHRITVSRIENYFRNQQHVDTVLLVNSLAREKGTHDSDIDMAILVKPEVGGQTFSQIENAWLDFQATDKLLNDYKSSGRFAHIHLDIIDGNFEQEEWEDGVDANFFEVEIGNRLLYSKPLSREGDHFKSLKAQWLPYYDS